MRAHVIENGKVVNTIEVDSLTVFENLVEATSGSIGDDYNLETNEFTAPEIITPVPQQVTMRQARLALLQAGKLSDVAPAIDQLPSPQKEAAHIEWNYSSTVERNRPLVQALGPLLGLSEEELDNLFIMAATL